MGRLAIFWTLVCWVDLILHIVIGLNVFQHLQSFKSRKNPFLNDRKCQKGGFLDFGLLDRLDIAYDNRTK